MYSNSGLNVQNVEAIEIPFNRQVDKSTVVHIDKGILFRTEKGQASKPSHEET